MKRVLIAGKNSYLGESFYKWLGKMPNSYFVQIVDTKNNDWKNLDYSLFDVVINFAGIAHIKKIKPEMKPLFYSVNCDLAIEMCSLAKAFGVKQFIQLSSMNVYGEYCDCITDIDCVNPTNFYGDSKLKGDIGIHSLSSDTFKVASVRPPFVYGHGCTGNYNSVSKIAKKTIVFPNYSNKKSMIYIDNLCEFLRLLIEDCSNGFFIPQNKELVSTSQLVKEIAMVNNKKIWFTRLFNWLLKIGSKHNKLFRKAFGNDYCSLELSNCFNWEYDIVSFAESIKLTEGIK